MDYQVTFYDLKNNGEVTADITDGFDNYQVHIDQQIFWEYALLTGKLQYTEIEGGYEVPNYVTKTYTEGEFFDDDTEIDQKSLIIEFVEEKKVKLKKSDI